MEGTSPNKEANRERFVRIVERRVNTILNNLDSLGKCSNRRNYEYTDADVKRIFREIEKKCKEIRILFDGKGNTRAFKLE
ncbi:MAG: hypothetical protein JRJ38_01580 [Deltaproteobacteria bacterium]|nr:hypothetical protein [Deltaproteobacteria bacterium]